MGFIIFNIVYLIIGIILAKITKIIDPEEVNDEESKLLVVFAWPIFMLYIIWGWISRFINWVI